MTRIVMIVLFLLSSCAAPTEKRGIDARTSYWNADVRRYLHMHGSELELRGWLDRRSIEYSIASEGRKFMALLETVHEQDQTCPTDIYLVGEFKDARVLWYRVDVVKRPNCDNELAT